MGTNTLTTATDGTIIPASDHNSLVTALKDNFVPRDTTTLAPTDLAGDLGATTTRWDNAYLKKIILGAITSALSIEEDGSNRIIIKVGGSTALTIDSGGLIPDSIATDMIADSQITTSKIADNNVTNSKLGLTTATSSGCGNFSTSSTSYTQITNLSVTISCSNYASVLLMMVPDTAATSNILCTDASSNNMSIQFQRGGSDIGTYNFISSAAGEYYVNPLIAIAPASSGSQTFTVDAKTIGGTGSISVNNYKLYAVEL
jgi:hypothetical protein